MPFFNDESAAPSDKSDTESIRVFHGVGGPPIATIPRAVLTRFSARAAKVLGALPESNHLHVATDNDFNAVRHVLDWMQGEAGKTNAEVQPLGYGEIFEDAIRIHQACAALTIHRCLRGDAGRDDLVHYIRMAPLSLAEFAMIYEVVGHDHDLVRLAIIRTASWQRAWLNRAEGVGVPEWDAIVAYCREEGIEL